MLYLKAITQNTARNSLFSGKGGEPVARVSIKRGAWCQSHTEYTVPFCNTSLLLREAFF